MGHRSSAGSDPGAGGGGLTPGGPGMNGGGPQLVGQVRAGGQGVVWAGLTQTAPGLGRVGEGVQRVLNSCWVGIWGWVPWDRLELTRPVDPPGAVLLLADWFVRCTCVL